MKLDPQSERRIRRWLERMLHEARPGCDVEGGFRVTRDGRVANPWVRPTLPVDDLTEGPERT